MSCWALFWFLKLRGISMRDFDDFDGFSVGDKVVIIADTLSAYDDTCDLNRYGISIGDTGVVKKVKDPLDLAPYLVQLEGQEQWFSEDELDFSED